MSPWATLRRECGGGAMQGIAGRLFARTEYYDDGIARIAAAIFYLVFGLEKFPATPGGEWVVLFHQIGFGDWFRIAAGTIEVLGALLVLAPRTALAGLLLLACTMGGAVLLLAARLHRASDIPFPGLFLVGLLVMAWLRWRAAAETGTSEEPA